MKIISAKVVNQNAEDDTIPMSEMEPLQVGRIVTEGSHQGELVMRTASRYNFEIMTFSNPGINSCFKCPGSARVKLLPKGSEIVLKVG